MIYALCDFELLLKYNLTLPSYILKISPLLSNNKIVMLQYRDKINNINVQKENILYLKKHLNIPIIINDNIELVSFCDGIHLGQADIDNLTNDREKFINDFSKSGKIIGLSTHNKEEILEANNYKLDYIGLGAYRSTSTKKDVANILGNKIEYLATLSNHKVAVIGGVRIDDKIKNISYLVIGSNLCQI